jgi:hypothetical protein
LDKSDVKVGTATEIGCRLDDMLEAQVRELHRFEGAVTAFRTGALAVEGLEKAVDRELDEGAIPDLETASLLKKYTGRMHQVLTNLAMQADNNRLMQTGKISAMQGAVEVTRKFREEEMNRAVTLRSALEQNKARTSDHVVASPEDRPGLSIKERRLAEEASEEDPLPVAPVKNGVSSHKVDDLLKVPGEKELKTAQPRPKPKKKAR